LLLVGLLVTAASCDVAPTEKGVLFEGESPYSTIIVTENDRGIRTLRFEEGGARQSVVKLGDPDAIQLPYARVMPVGFALVEQPQRVLIVGLGGGTIPSFLRHHMPQLNIDVVDIDPVVVDVAKRYFGFREDGRMHAHVDDGRAFIERSPGRYDIIFLDAFSAENIPQHLSTREFLQAARRAITADGVVMANIWGRRSSPLYDSMVRTYQDVFQQLYVLDVQGAGNKILIALPRDEQVQRDDLMRRATEMSERYDFPFDMGTLVGYGFRPAGNDGAEGQVLTDGDGN
jgi:spermidine synthase